MGGSGRLIPGDIRTLLVPGDDLGLQGPTGQPLKLGQDIDLTLAVLTAQGPNGPKLVRTDDDGFVLVSAMPGGIPAVVKHATGTLAAGIIYTAPADIQASLINGTLIITSTATVGNRNIVLDVKDSAGNLLARLLGNTAQPVSTVFTYILMGGIGFTNVTIGATTTNAMFMPSPLYIPSGGTITVQDLQARDTADAFNSTLMIVESEI